MGAGGREMGVGGTGVRLNSVPLQPAQVEKTKAKTG